MIQKTSPELVAKQVREVFKANGYSVLNVTILRGKMEIIYNE